MSEPLVSFPDFLPPFFFLPGEGGIRGLVLRLSNLVPRPPPACSMGYVVCVCECVCTRASSKTSIQEDVCGEKDGPMYSMWRGGWTYVCGVDGPVYSMWSGWAYVCGVDGPMYSMWSGWAYVQYVEWMGLCTVCGVDGPMYVERRMDLCTVCGEEDGPMYSMWSGWAYVCGEEDGPMYVERRMDLCMWGGVYLHRYTRNCLRFLNLLLSGGRTKKTRITQTSLVPRLHSVLTQGGGGGGQTHCSGRESTYF